MKKLLQILNLFFLFFILQSCNKTIVERNLEFPALDPLKTDINAGVWKPILLTGPTEFHVAAPAATTTPAYVSEINEIKGWQKNLNETQKNSIAFWSAGAVLRWNEILRELVAKHNIPPYQNADGTYPIPSAANPFAYPVFPFSNPPYAARAYAYVAAAQYDALIASYYYKKLYNRQAPYKIDAGVKALVPQNNLGSYPSEDAAVVGVTVELLKLLFPADQDFIQQKAEEHKRYRIIAGANVRSDIDAGELLGKAVAQKFTARARTDRAGSSVGTAILWAQMELQTAATGEMPWISQDLPKRPPMLPLFGKVKTFLFDSLTMVTNISSSPPPSTNSVQFKIEADEVLYYAKNYDRNRIEIVHFWADGANTYTPPGHWDAIASEDFVKQRFSEVRWARNMALLNMSLMDAAVVCWDTKYKYFNPRPSQFNPDIKTWTGIPNFPSYTSGHSTFSGAASAILGHIIPAKATAYNDMAKQASLSRLYGALHYRSDCDSGLVCGKKVGSYAIARAMNDGADF